MRVHCGVSRVIVVILDGLRADAIPLFRLPHLSFLAHEGAATLRGRTITPSITTAAVTSLMTGVAPQIHGMESDQIGIPRRADSLEPLPTHLAAHGVTTRAYIATPPRPFRGMAQRIAARADATLHFAGDRADQIMRAAVDDLERYRDGYFYLHWPDADRIGHAHGWLSSQYRDAVRGLDANLGQLVTRTGVLDDPSTVLIALSDHGGGGTRRNNHNSPHPLDTTIPILLAGGRIARGDLMPTTSLLDVPATVAWLLTGMVPSSYQGRVLMEAFDELYAPHMSSLR